MRLLLWPLALVPILSVAAFSQTIWYVDASSTPPGDGSFTWPYSSLQYAIDQPATMENDMLWIAPGRYPENVQLTGKNLDLHGQGGALGAIIDGQGVGPCLSLTSIPVGTGVPETRVSGLTFTGGGGVATAFGTAGGAVYCADSDVPLVFEECMFLHNTSPAGTGVGRGAGLYAANCDRIWMTNCLFTSNVAEGGDGQAVYLVDSEIYMFGCEFVANGDPLGSSGNGGAVHSEDSDVYASESAFVANICGGDGGAIHSFNAYVEADLCRFIDNRAGAHGGAMASTSQAGARLVTRGCDFVGNRSAGGGAMYVGGDFGLVEQCQFVDNIASSTGPQEGHGGAILFAQAGTANHRIWYSTFEENAADGNASHDGRGGAIYGDADLFHCTLTANDAEGPGAEGGAYFGAGFLDSCISWSNDPDEIGGGAGAGWSDVTGGWPGVGNVDVDPMFGPLLSLQPGSPCIDTGNPARTDADGSRADMGARPWQWISLGTRYCATGTNSTGLAASIDAKGSASVSANFLVLEAAQAPPSTSGIFLASLSHGYVPNVGGGQGTLCLGTPLVRFVGNVVGTDSMGRVEFQLDFGNLPPGAVFVPGDVWSFQFLFRDANPSATSNLTDGVIVPLTN